MGADLNGICWLCPFGPFDLPALSGLLGEAPRELAYSILIEWIVPLLHWCAVRITRASGNLKPFF